MNKKKNIDFNLSYIYCIITLLILLLNGFILVGFNVSAGSSWILTTDSDFNNGTLENLTVVGIGNESELMLERIEDLNWSKQSPASSPSGRHGHKMATVYSDDKVLLFGGYDNNVFLQDTWVYDLSQKNWIEKINTVNKPSKREYYGLAAVWETDKVILFGGFPINNETWIYNMSNNTWFDLKPSGNIPSARFAHSIATIWGTDKILLFGGYTKLNETWIYDLSDNNWTQLAPNNIPTGRYSPAMAPIYGTDKVLLFAGVSDIGINTVFLDDTWIFDLSDGNWTEKSPANPPYDRFEHAMESVYGTDKVLLYGGRHGSSFRHTWFYDLGEDTWTRHILTYIPERRYDHGLAAFYRTNKFVLFGGLNPMKSDTWIFTSSLYSHNGSFMSTPYDLGPNCLNSTVKTISWDAAILPDTGIKFQLRSAMDKSTLLNSEFVGPDGNSSTNYTASPTSIWLGHSCDRWMQVKVYFNSTQTTNNTPSLDNIIISYNFWPNTSLAKPENDLQMNDNTPDFKWQFIDSDSTHQTAFQVLISKDSEFTNIVYDSGKQSSINNSWQFPNGTSYTNIPDGTWYWKACAKDNDGDWGYFTKPFKFIIDTNAPNSNINYPLNNSYLSQLDYINGTSLDQNGTGINKIEISIMKVNPDPIVDEYWNGNNWVKSETWLNTSGTKKWSFNAGEVLWHSNLAYVIRSRAIDNASNFEYPNKENRFIFDDIPPTINFFSIEDGKEFINSQVVTISYSISDIRSRDGSYDMAFSFDNESWTEWEPIYLNVNLTLPNNDGKKFVYMRLRDRAGNTGEIVNDSIILDTTKPIECSILVNDVDIFTRFQNITLSLFAIDSLSGVDEMSFSFDSYDWTDWENYNEEKTLDLPTNNGEKTIYFRVKDKANNIADYVSDKIILDTLPPENLTVTINNNSEFTNSSTIDLVISANDILSGLNNMSFSYDNVIWTEWVPFSTSRSIELREGDGEKIIHIRVNDKAGNIKQATDEIVLDTKPPDSLSIEINNGDLETNTVSVALNLNAIDEISGLFQMSFSNDGILWTEWEDYSKTKTHTLSFGNGLKTIFFRVKDKAGNIAEPISSSINLRSSTTNLDLDGDGYPNDVDAFPNDPTQWSDIDGDNYGDNLNGTNPDHFPNDRTKWKKEGKPPEKKNDDSFWLIISATIVIIIIVIILLFFLLIKRKKKSEIEPETQSAAETEKEIQQQLSQQTQQSQQIQEPKQAPLDQQTQIQPQEQPQQLPVQPQQPEVQSTFQEQQSQQQPAQPQQPEVQPTYQDLQSQEQPAQPQQPDVQPTFQEQQPQQLLVQPQQPQVQPTFQEQQSQQLPVQPQQPQVQPTFQEQQSQQLPVQPQQPQVQPTFQEQQPQQNLCTTCGQGLTYYSQNNKYYCHQCKKYE